MPINSLNLSRLHFNKLGSYDLLPPATMKRSINIIVVTYSHPCCPIHIEGVDKVYHNCSHSMQLNTHTKNYFTREPHPSEPNLHLGPCLHELKPTSCLCKSKTEFNTDQGKNCRPALQIPNFGEKNQRVAMFESSL